MIAETKHEQHGELAALRAALRDGDGDARLLALRAIAPATGAPSGAPAALAELLIEVMGDSDFRVRKEAAAAAVRLCRGAADPAPLAAQLVTALSEPDDVGRRNAALEAVVGLGARSVPALLADLAGRPEHRKVLCDALGLIGDPRAVAALGESLADEDANVRAAAAEALGLMPPPAGAEVVPHLRRALGGDADLVVRLGALDGLNRHAAPLQLSEVRPFLDQAVMRPSALRALSRCGDPGALPLLVGGLLDRAPGAREAALSALRELHERADAGEREQIEAALLSLSELAVRSMIRALLEANAEARRAAATLLRHTGRRDVVRPLILALLDGRPEIAEAAAASLVHLGASAIEVVCDLLPELDEGGRAGLFRFFGSALDPAVELAPSTAARAQALLRDGLSAGAAATVVAAAEALGKVGGAEALAPLLAARARGAGDKEGRAAILLALRALSFQHRAALQAELAPAGEEVDPEVRALLDLI